MDLSIHGSIYSWLERQIRIRNTTFQECFPHTLTLLAVHFTFSVVANVSKTVGESRKGQCNIVCYYSGGISQLVLEMQSVTRKESCRAQISFIENTKATISSFSSHLRQTVMQNRRRQNWKTRSAIISF